MTFHDNDVTNHVTVNCHIAKGHRHLDCNSANVQIAAATHVCARHTTSNAIHPFIHLHPVQMRATTKMKSAERTATASLLIV